MSNVSNDTQRADQIAYRFYTKLALVVNHARATAEPNPQTKVDKWVCTHTSSGLQRFTILTTSSVV